MALLIGKKNSKYIGEICLAKPSPVLNLLNPFHPADASRSAFAFNKISFSISIIATSSFEFRKHVDTVFIVDSFRKIKILNCSHSIL